LTSLKLISFSRRTQLHGVSKEGRKEVRKKERKKESKKEIGGAKSIYIGTHTRSAVTQSNSARFPSQSI